MSKNNFWSKKIFAPRKFCVQNIWVKKMLVENDFWSKKNLDPKKYLGLKKILGLDFGLEFDNKDNLKNY